MEEALFKNKLNHHSTGIYTLCFLKHRENYLLIKRTKDPNAGFLNGLGGKVSRFESPEENIQREFEEESGLILKRFYLRGILRIVEDKIGKDYLIFVYLANKFSGVLRENNTEGQLQWIPSNEIQAFPVVPNIKIFLPLLEATKKPLEIHFIYPKGRKGFYYRYNSGSQKIENYVRD